MLTFARVAVLIAASLGLILTRPVAAAEPEGCPGLIASRDNLFSWASLGQDEVGLSFVGHATFLIQTPQGVRIATDYNDGTRPPVTPDVATMNKAHSTHFSYRPDPGITYVLRGWNPAGGPAVHDLTVQDVRIRNVSTNISCASPISAICTTPSRLSISRSSGVLMFCWCRWMAATRWRPST
jgi:hypothetical protein